MSAENTTPVDAPVNNGSSFLTQLQDARAMANNGAWPAMTIDRLNILFKEDKLTYYTLLGEGMNQSLHMLSRQRDVAPDETTRKNISVAMAYVSETIAKKSENFAIYDVAGAPPTLNPPENARGLLNFFVQMGLPDEINSDNLPFLGFIPKDETLGYRIDACKVKINEWRSRRTSGSGLGLNEDVMDVFGVDRKVKYYEEMLSDLYSQVGCND